MFQRRHLTRVFAAGGVLLLLCLLDFVMPSGGWYATHPMTSSAIATTLGFVAAGMFLEEWLREREAGRLSLISTVAYRSLAQYANDAGRTLLAPLTGADLYLLGIPGATPSQADEDLELLEGRGHRPTFAETTGSWNRERGQALRPVLRDLLHDPEFVSRMFRRTALMRRRLQEVTALWSPVMLTSARHAEDLGRMRQLTDALELLQEQIRLGGSIGVLDSCGWKPSPNWIERVSSQFWEAIHQYEVIRDEFGDLAALPSDTIVNRRDQAALST